MKVKVWKSLGLLFITIVALSAANTVHAVETTPSIAWSQIYSSIDVDEAQSVIQTNDGGFLLICSKWPSTYLQYSTGVFYLLKVDSSGNQQWNQTYSGIVLDGQHIVQTADGGYAVAAEIQNRFLLLKTDQSGNQQWNQTYAGAGICAATALVQTSDGGFALVGISNYDPIYEKGGTGYKVWLVKTDSHGNPQWNQTLGEGQAYSLVQTTDGGYAIASDPNFLLIKADSNGNLQWNRTYGNPDKDEAYSVVQTSDGGYALGGWMWLRSNGGGPNYAIVKTDATGNMQWTQYYGAGPAWTMTKTSDGGFAIAGTKLVKVDAAGNEQWSINVKEFAYSVVQTRDGGYATAGSTSENTSQAWLAKIDAANTNQTTQPSTSPLVTPSPTNPEFPTWTIPPVLIIAVVAVVLVSAGLLVYFKKRSHARINKHSEIETFYMIF
jgi:hypothetical protein